MEYINSYRDSLTADILPGYNVGAHIRALEEMKKVRPDFKLV